MKDTKILFFLVEHYTIKMVYWHINLLRLFNGKSIFIQIISSISNNSLYHEYTVQLLKTFLFQAIQFSQTVLIQTIQFSIVLFDP